MAGEAECPSAPAFDKSRLPFRPRPTAAAEKKICFFPAFWLCDWVIVTPGTLNRRAELYHQLGSMLTAGVPLIKALEMASANRSLRTSQKTFRGLIQHLQSGLTFGESMVQVQGWMPEFDVSLLSVGEQSGRLDASFKQLATYYAFRASIIRETINSLITTLATLHVFLLVFPLPYLVQFAMGILNGNYVACIPFIIQKVEVFGAAYGAVFLLIYACQGKHGERWRALVEAIEQLIPILRTALRYLALSRLSAALESLIRAGVNIIEGWQMAAVASGSPQLREEISSWKAPLVAGATPSEMINQSKCFPDMFANLYNTAEISGQLDETLDRLHEYFLEEGMRKLRTFTYIMNGTIYGLVVLLVAYNVFGFYLGRMNNILQMTQ
jgi:type II secretory pathway component PulF